MSAQSKTDSGHVAVHLAGSGAPELNARQRKYDLLHHEYRLEWLSAAVPTYSCGTPVCAHDVRNMRTHSEAALALGISTNSVDLTDAAYLAELDAFASQVSA